MYLYIIFGILTILSFFDILIEKDKRPTWYPIIFTCTVLILFILSAFRFERGADWLAYNSYFVHCSSWGSEGWMEGGFTLLNKVVNSVVHNFSLMVFVVASIVYIFKPQVIYKLSPYPFLALLTWYSMSMADIFPVRQTIASAFVLYSVIFIIRRQFLPFLLFIVLATTFHTTALIFIIAYFIYSIRLSAFWSLLAFIGSFSIAFLAQGFMANILESISNPFIQERIENYLEQGADNTFGSAYTTSQVLVRGFINRGMIIALIFLLLNRFRKEDAIFNGWVNMFLFSSTFFAVLTTVNVALGRLVVYFDMSQVFIFAYIFLRKMDRPNKMVIFVILIVYLLYRFYGVVNNYYDLYIPYKSLFWNSDLPVKLF